jgi:hypothetical protein
MIQDDFVNAYNDVKLVYTKNKNVTKYMNQSKDDVVLYRVNLLFNIVLEIR